MEKQEVKAEVKVKAGKATNRIINRFTVTTVLILAQVAWLVVMLFTLTEYGTWVSVGLQRRFSLDGPVHYLERRQSGV